MKRQALGASAGMAHPLRCCTLAPTPGTLGAGSQTGWWHTRRSVFARSALAGVMMVMVFKQTVPWRICWHDLWCANVNVFHRLARWERGGGQRLADLQMNIAVSSAVFLQQFMSCVVSHAGMIVCMPAGA